MSASLTLVQAPAAASPASTRPASASSRRKWYTLAVLCLSLLITVVDSTIVNVALPSLARDLRAGTSGLQWITDSYTLAFGALLLLAGAIADRFGRHRSLAGRPDGLRRAAPWPPRSPARPRNSSRPAP